MSKHSAGPWSATLWGNEEFSGWQFSAGGSLLPLDDATGDPEEAEANARLIAAAPELLEALQEMQKQLRRTSASLWTNEQAEADLMACAAIAKATGEQA